MLQTIRDLTAFGLQTLRASVTCDQVPSLIRHGAVTLAIDGFDELADPFGYRLAWAALNDLVTATRGHGALILCGRETFLSPHQVLDSLPAIEQATDLIVSFSLVPPSKDGRPRLVARPRVDQGEFQ